MLANILTSNIYMHEQVTLTLSFSMCFVAEQKFIILKKYKYEKKT